MILQKHHSMHVNNLGSRDMLGGDIAKCSNEGGISAIARCCLANNPCGVCLVEWGLRLARVRSTPSPADGSEPPWVSFLIFIEHFYAFPLNIFSILKLLQASQELCMKENRTMARLSAVHAPLPNFMTPRHDFPPCDVILALLTWYDGHSACPVIFFCTWYLAV